MKRGILPVNGYFFFLEKCEMVKFNISFQKKNIFRNKIQNQNERVLNGSEASVTIEKCLIPEPPLEKVPYTFKVKYTYCSGNRESVPMCVFL